MLIAAYLGLLTVLCILSEFVIKTSKCTLVREPNCTPVPANSSSRSCAGHNYLVRPSDSSGLCLGMLAVPSVLAALHVVVPTGKHGQIRHLVAAAQQRLQLSSRGLQLVEPLCHIVVGFIMRSFSAFMGCQDMKLIFSSVAHGGMHAAPGSLIYLHLFPSHLLVVMSLHRQPSCHALAGPWGPYLQGSLGGCFSSLVFLLLLGRKQHHIPSSECSSAQISNQTHSGQAAAATAAGEAMESAPGSTVLSAAAAAGARLQRQQGSRVFLLVKVFTILICIACLGAMLTTALQLNLPPTGNVTATQQQSTADVQYQEAVPSQQQHQQYLSVSLQMWFQQAGWQLWCPALLVALNPLLLHIWMLQLPGCFSLGEGILLSQGLACVSVAAAQELPMLPAAFVPWDLLLQLLHALQQLLVLLPSKWHMGPEMGVFLMQQIQQLEGWGQGKAAGGAVLQGDGMQQQQQGGVLPAFIVVLVSSILLLCLQLRLLVLTLQFCWPECTDEHKHGQELTGPVGVAANGATNLQPQQQARKQQNGNLRRGLNAARGKTEQSSSRTGRALLGCLLTPLLLLSLLPVLLVVLCLAVWTISSFLMAVPSRLAVLGYWVAVLLGSLPLMKSAAVRAGLPQVRLLMASSPAVKIISIGRSGYMM